MVSEIFVFGSNLAGRHGKGAALCAMRAHGAVYGKGVGPQGNSYAIPTKSARFQPLPLHIIAAYVDAFLDYASRYPDTVFNVTRVGCGLAGYHDRDIAPMFKAATSNVKLPLEWKPYVDV